jgi:hypothetical protein
MMDKPTTAISEFVNGQAPPELGLPVDRMPEAEVALRLAEFILSLPGSGAMASIRINDAVLFDIGRFMAGTGWEQVKEPQVGRKPGPARTGAATRPSVCIHARARATSSPPLTAVGSFQNARRVP